jgi:CBS domain containing-hemolysin-like protein
MEQAMDDLGGSTWLLGRFLLQVASEPTVSIGTSNVYIQAIMLVVSIAMVAFFSSAEASLISVNRVRVQYLAEQGNRAARAVNRVLEQREKFFATILLTENAFIIFASSVGTAVAVNFWGGHGLVLVLAPLAMTVVIVILGEITPKTLAAGAADRWALVVARPITAIMWLETYLIYLFTLLPRYIIRMMGGPRTFWTPSVTEGELRMLIKVGRAEGALDAAEAALLEKVFHFGDRQVQEVMVPRNEIVWVEEGTTVKDFLAMYAEHNHTRFPVYLGSTDNVVGVLYIKDVLAAQAQGRLPEQGSVTGMLRPAYFVPETKTVSSTFTEMQRHGHGLGLMVDEFGGIAGLATLELLMEVIVGDVTEGSAPPEDTYIPVDENTFHVDAGASISEVNAHLNLGLPEGDYQTLAGFVLDRLGRIPREGDVLEYRDLQMTVKAMSGVKIETVEVERVRQPLPEAAK